MSFEGADTWESAAGFETAAAGGGGGSSGTPDRIAPTGPLTYFDFTGLAAGSIANQGTGGALAITPNNSPSGNLFNLPGEYGENAVGCVAQNSGGQIGGRLISAATTKGESTAWSVNFWFFPISVTSYSGVMPLTLKMLNAGAGDYNPSFYVAIFNDWTVEGLAQTAGGNYVVLDGPTPLTLGVRHHIALTYDGTTLKLYIDGVSVATGTGGAMDWGSHGEYCWLGWANTAYPNSPPGLLSDWRWDTTALSAGDIAAIYATGRRPS